ncbi:lysophospholipid acyltransferase LPCAT4-like [Pholidichthys leucotaenia]
MGSRKNSTSLKGLNPFVHEVKLTCAQRIKELILGSLLFPLRVVLATAFMLLAWPVASLRVVGLSAEERSRPLTGWRRWLIHPILWVLGRAVFFCLGFLHVKVKGRRADVKEAPVLVVAPHSGFFDMIIMFSTQLPMVVSRSENLSLPIIGALLECIQSVVVSRKDPESRRKTVAQINERLNSNGYWPQMLMFPEGTTTNGRSLIKFKAGAFLPGVPVQPVLLRYPNKLDTVRWTYKGTTWYQAMWHTVSQLYTNLTVEFLPVYVPSQEEKNNPSLYADNVQTLMAKALGVPATDHMMEGGVPVRKLGDLSLPVEPRGREVMSLLCSKGVGVQEVEVVLGRMIGRCQPGAKDTQASAEELASIFGLTDKETARHICGLYSKGKSADLRQIYFSVLAVTSFVDLESILHSAFTTFDREGHGSLNVEELSDLMGALLGFPQQDSSALHAVASSDGQLTEDNLLRVLKSHPVYREVVREYLQLEEASH